VHKSQQTVILESIGLQHLDDKSWLVTSRPPKGYADFAGFDLGRPTWDRAGAMGLTRVKDKFEKDTVKDGLASDAIEPIDVLDFFLSRKSVDDVRGILLHAEEGLYERVVDLLAQRAVRILGAVEFDIITNVHSSKPLSGDLAKAIASYTKKQFIAAGVLKTKDPERVTVAREVDKTIGKNLARLKRAIANGENPSMRKAFHPRQRSHVQGYLEPSMDALDVATDPTRKTPARVVVVDDILTTGSAAREAKHELESIGYDVVVTIAAFRADSRRA